MKRTLLLFAALIFTSSLAHGQSACAQLGVDCSHPNIAQAPVCGPDCRAAARERQDEYWARRQDYLKERAAEKQRRDEQKAAVKAWKENKKRIDTANSFADQAWAYMQKEDCGKAVDLYDKALKLNSFLQWSTNRATCLGKLKRLDAAYASWEALINNRNTPDSEIRPMRFAEWSIMNDKGYICPTPPFFNGIEGCYRRPDKKTLDSIYVPLPYIEGKYWTPKQVVSSGPFTITTRDGRVWQNNEVNVTTLNLLDARIQTGQGTAVRFLLPDDTTFNLGPNSDITIDDFVYDPNESRSTMTMNVVKGLFRFVSGKLSHSDPASKIIFLKSSTNAPAATGGQSNCKDGRKPCVISIGIRGTDVEFSHDPNGNGTMSEGVDRWWICAYDGEINISADQNYPVPIGQCFIHFSHADGIPVTYANDHSSIGLMPNYDDSPGAADTAIRKGAELSVTDQWESVMPPQSTGRQ